jgi:hypothetical protein
MSTIPIMSTKMFSPLNLDRMNGLPKHNPYRHRRKRSYKVCDDAENLSTLGETEKNYNNRIVAAEQEQYEMLTRRISTLLYQDESKGNTFFPYPYPEPPIVFAMSRFNALKNIWKKETFYISSITEKCNHWAYQQIIGMGREVVPFILKELESNLDHWFSALCEITGINPVPSESQGKVKEMTFAWLEWARKNGISW